MYKYNDLVQKHTFDLPLIQIINRTNGFSAKKRCLHLLRSSRDLPISHVLKEFSIGLVLAIGYFQFKEEPVSAGIFFTQKVFCFSHSALLSLVILPFHHSNKVVSVLYINEKEDNDFIMCFQMGRTWLNSSRFTHTRHIHSAHGPVFKDTRNTMWHSTPSFRNHSYNL